MLFLFFTLLNKMAMNISVQFFVWACVFNFLGYMCKGGISGSNGNYV